MKRAVLASGSLYLSSPLPVERGNGLIKALEAKVQEYGESSLRKASVPALLQALKESNVNTMWIQEDDELKGWETRIEQADEVMIGDTEYEVCFLSTLHNSRLTAQVCYLEKRNRNLRWRDHCRRFRTR